jgi:microcin C transport system ATP-binding protein
MPLLTVRDLSVRFHAAERDIEAVKGVSFAIAKGETAALVGESGSGKTVTALSIMQLLPYPTASHPSGSIRFDGEELIGAAPSLLAQIRGARVSMIFQEPMTSLNPLHTVERQINETLILHKGLKPKAARARTLELLHLAGLADAANRLQSYPHQLSGGQRQRVMIAMALANEPDLLIADEPTTALDVTVQAQILALVRSLQRKLGMAVLWITHDLDVVRKIAETVYVMTEGKIVESGSIARVFADPRHPYTRHLLASRPGPKPPASEPPPPVLIDAKGVRVWFPVRAGLFRRTVDYIRAVDGVSLQLREGRTLGVVGESGSGKTTLAYALLRLIRCQGSIRYRQRELQGLGLKALRPLRQEMQVVFQDPFASLSPRLSVFQIVEEGLKVHGRGDYAERRRLATEALQEVGIPAGALDRFPHEFSGGQRQRIAIARALVLKPCFLVLDEPTSALDMSVQAQIIDLLLRLQQRHRLAYLFISHDLKVVRALADDVLVLKDGRVVEEGPAERIFTEPKTAYTRALIAAAFQLEAIETEAVKT